MGHTGSKEAEDAIWNCDLNLSEIELELGRYDYPFENLVLEGGGAKGIGYHGALKVLSELGIYPKFKRLSGTSIGSIGAALLSVGYSPAEAMRMTMTESDRYLSDTSCGMLSFLPNLIMNYGWNSGKNMLEWMGEKIEAKTGDKDITFKDLYSKYGKELCIVVTNVNQMDAEYCHVKTTPLMPIRIAVRMSVSIPAVLEPVRYGQGHSTDLYVDGGLLVNFPIHSFDGWWLSMKPEDAFLSKLTALDNISKIWDKRNRFGGYNEKTIGILVYTGDDHEINEHVMNQRRHKHEEQTRPIQRPNTKLVRDKEKKSRLKETTQAQYAETCAAMARFVSVMGKGDEDGTATVDLKELAEVLSNNEDFTAKDAEALFGEDFTIDSVFEKLDRDGDGEITMLELIHFAEERGVRLWSMFAGYDRYEVNSVGDYLTAVQETVLTNVKRLYNEEKDIDRTIAIYLDYIEGGDFFTEPADRIFAIQQGAKATLTFLHHYVEKYKPPLKQESVVNEAPALAITIQPRQSECKKVNGGIEQEVDESNVGKANEDETREQKEGEAKHSTTDNQEQMVPEQEVKVNGDLDINVDKTKEEVGDQQQQLVNGNKMEKINEIKSQTVKDKELQQQTTSAQEQAVGE
ncbi:uncharacterized protein [Ptychodera flava]|uniref:uncharacterized protein n=1 Tax=Ptychodera flava TaxID=63121 RepID=UPI00396A2EB3